MTTETVFGQTLALQLGNGDEQRALESDTTGLNVKGNLYLYLSIVLTSGKPNLSDLGLRLSIYFRDTTSGAVFTTSSFTKASN